MHLLALDLGLTTGYAVLEEDGSIVTHGTMPWQELDIVLVDLLREYTPRWVVAEPPVIIRGPLGEKLTYVVSSVRQIVHDVEEIDPAQWKNSWWRDVPTPRPKNKKGISQHQKDALRMGWWYLEVKLKRSNIRANVLRNV